MNHMDHQPRKPIFSFLFTPKPDTPGAGQDRWLRIPARGPLRVITLLIATVALASFGGAILFSLASVRSLTGLALGTLVIAATLPAVWLVSRGWTTGTYVNDSGVKISRWWSTTHVPWAMIDRIDHASSPGGQRLMLHTKAGVVATTIASRSVDVWGRTEAWWIAQDRVNQWWRETRPPAQPGTP